MHNNSLTLTLAATMTVTALLGGCSTAPSTPSASLTQAQITALHQSIRKEFTPMNLAANKDWLSGNVALDITIDRNNQLLGCTAKSVSGDTDLVAVAERACRATAFPPMPAEVFDPDGKARIRMPLVFSMPTDQDPKQRASFEAIIFPAFSQGQYFWDNGISGVATSSVGQAQFRYIADREGRVIACDVRIAEIESRKAEFRQSPQLVSRLHTACMNMNLAKMSGFAVSHNGLATGSVWTSYLPWRRAAPKVADK